MIVLPIIINRFKASGCASRFRRHEDRNKCGKDGWSKGSTSSGEYRKNERKLRERGSSVISRLREFESWRDAISRGKTTDDEEEEKEEEGTISTVPEPLKIISTQLSFASQSVYLVRPTSESIVCTPAVCKTPRFGLGSRGISRNSTPTSCIFMHRSNRCNCSPSRVPRRQSVQRNDQASRQNGN